MPDKALILAVDDTPEVLNLMSDILRPRYRVKAATNGQRALEIAGRKPQPDLILLDVMMPELDGHEVCRRLKADPATREIPVIFITALGQALHERRGFELGAVDYVSKPISPPVLEARVGTHLKLHNQQRELNRMVRERTRQLDSTRLQVIRRLGRAAEFKDNETGLHVIRMSHYTRLLAEAAGGNAEWVDLLFNAAPMHDIGKIGIPDRILTKPGALTREERAIMQRHPGIGAEIIGESDSDLLQLAREVALTHHENWDGSGYPARLAGERIPLAGRIAAVADVFDALTMMRPYKAPWPVEQAVAYIRSQAGLKFDPRLVARFLEIIPELRKVQDTYQETAEGDGAADRPTA
jgi:putative two-component system response regulator